MRFVWSVLLSEVGFRFLTEGEPKPVDQHIFKRIRVTTRFEIPLVEKIETELARIRWTFTNKYCSAVYGYLSKQIFQCSI